MNDDPEPVAATVRDYYAALRAGEPLTPFFLGDETTTKVGVSEHLVGHETVAAGLEEQTETTTDWAVDSHTLQAGRRGDTGWFSDRVEMGWTGAQRHEYETRWTGALVRQPGSPTDGHEWSFVTMHVSASHDLAEDG